MYYVYVLWSDILGKKYIGRTDDLRRRLKEHNNGQTNFTNRGKPWKLVYYEAFVSKSDSVNEEVFLKTGKGRDRLKFILKECFSGEVA